MRFAYADPPYIGLAHKYPEKTEVDHRELIARLCSEFADGWALSCHTNALRIILPLCPESARVCAWVKPWASLKTPVRIAYAWEPVIINGGRPKDDKTRVIKDWHESMPAMKVGFFGAKPESFCLWILDCLGYKNEDEIVDLYPGTGIMGCVSAQLGLL